MLNKTRKHLIIIYTFTAGIILTALFIVMLAFLTSQYRKNQREIFLTHLFSLQNKIQSDITISDSWLYNTERSNRLIIHIIDNGSPLFYSNSSSLVRNQLIEQIEQLATKDGILLNSRPISSNIIQSSIYHINEFNRSYYGAALVIAKTNGYCTLILLQNIDHPFSEIFREYFLFFSLDLVGIISLFLIIRKLVDHTLQPVKDNQQKQIQFIAAASHELRSPLSVIKANNSLIKITNESFHNCEQIIDAECNRMERLINDMLLLASGDSSTWTMQKETINMDTLLFDIYDSILFKANNLNIQIKLLLPEENLPSIEGDYDRLLQVLTILLDNAIYYSANGQTIELSAKIEKKYLSLFIIDHGIGIPDSEKAIVFDRFYRSDQSRKDKAHFGLGLSIAKELILLHHGSIHVMDTPFGGATFVVRLPRN